MKVKEILSYHLNEDFGIVYIDFILEDDESEKNEEALYEGLEYYINNTENVLNL